MSDNIVSFFTSPNFTGIFNIVRISFITAFIILSIGTIIVFSKASWKRSKYLENYTEFFAYHPYGVKKGFKRWSKIIGRIETGKETECKMAIIEADDLLKEVLLKMKYKGEILDDLLAQVDAKIMPSIETVKEVHKIRNNIIQDPSYSLTVEQARNIIRVYQKGLTELEMF